MRTRDDKDTHSKAEKNANRLSSSSSSSTDSESAYLIVTDRKNPPSEIGAHSLSMQHPKMDKELTHQQSKIKGGRKIGPSKTDTKTDVKTRYPIDLYENVDYPAVKNDKRAGATTK
ncbi:hypothetical protein MAR_005465 [Mya arenaria]|uniref:Uncharacterized protein n=1 Tax=Mya arenaria TaxID=6604 RepID=A0ABY7EZN4_MYAAR|nr:hypothetical protein MAR_005465 [Mya arenaria]